MLEVQLESASAEDHPPTTPHVAEQKASGPGADNGGASWAAWRSDQQGEVGPWPFHHACIIHMGTQWSMSSMLHC